MLKASTVEVKVEDNILVIRAEVSKDFLKKLKKDPKAWEWLSKFMYMAYRGKDA